MTDTIERTRSTPPVRRKRRSRWRSMVFIVLLVAVGFVATGVLPVQQYLERGNQVAVAQQRLDELVEQNRVLEEDAQALLTDQEIERVAREQYGFVRPGEVGYTVIAPDMPDETPSSAPTPVEGPSESRGFFQRIWDFISGRDVAADG